MLAYWVVGFALQIASQPGPVGQESAPEPALGSALSAARISDRALKDVEQAVKSSEAGERGRAVAWLRGILLLDGVKVIAQDRRLEAACKSAIETWKREVSDSPFQTANSANTLKVSFMSRRESRERGNPAHVQGKLEVSRRLEYTKTSGNMIVEGVITVRPNADGKALTTNQLTQVVAHELGHLLGLDDMPGGEGLMGPFRVGKTVTSPTASEVYAVMRFRRLAWKALLALDKG